MIDQLDGLREAHSRRESAAHEHDQSFEPAPFQLAARRWHRRHLAAAAGAQEPADVRHPTPSCATPSATLAYADDVKAVVFAPNGGNFCSGGDVHDIIGPLLDKDMKGLLAFTRMTGDW